MAWRRPGAKPLSEPMMGTSLTHICVTRPQWVKVAIHMHIDYNIIYAFFIGIADSKYIFFWMNALNIKPVLNYTQGEEDMISTSF